MRLLYALITVMLITLACEPESRTSQEAEKEEANTVHRSVPAVCVWDGASVRKGHSANSEWITSLSLGEKVTWLGIEQPDSAKPDRSYYKVMLSDSTVGWSSEYVIAQGEPGVVVTETPVFKRPDLITMTQTTLQPMSFVAVIESDGEWVRIVGNQNKPKGWIKLDSISLQESDVAVGVIYTKMQGLEDEDEKHQKLKELISNPVFENSVFIDELKKELEKINPVD